MGHRRHPLPRRHRGAVVHQRGARAHRDRGGGQRPAEPAGGVLHLRRLRRRRRRSSWPNGSPLLAPVPDSKVFFTSGGSDSVETAAKLARRYWHEVGQPDKRIVIGRQKAYHGMHYAGTALSGLPPNREGYGELVHDAATVAWDSAADLDDTIERLGRGQRGRVLLRAGHGCRRRVAAARRLPRRGARRLPRARRAVRRRRGRDRLRPDRRRRGSRPAGSGSSPTW